MIIKITFDPDTLKPEDEAWLPFQKGGMLLRFWALYKKSFITSQHFKDTLQMMSDAFDDAAAEKRFPYNNIDQFVCLFYECSEDRFSTPRRQEFGRWAVNNWHHLSWNLHVPVTIQFDRVEPVTRLMKV